jgi:hypothetical protein
MAEWRQVAKVCALGDGHISKKKVEILRKVILADNSANKSELDFLKEIKSEAKSSVQELDILIEDCNKVAK